MPLPAVIVGGVHKGAGKTTLSCFLLRHLPGWGALKVTTTHEGTVCPVEASCTACGELAGPYWIVRDAAVIGRQGTDTWKMQRTGAARVLWLRATPEHLAEGLVEALASFAGLPGLVIEGTNVARHRPDLYLLAARPPVRKIKPSARATADRADLPVLNLAGEGPSAPDGRLLQELPVFRRAMTFRGLAPEAAENSELLAVVRARLALPPRE